jgi:hypothetical protein
LRVVQAGLTKKVTKKSRRFADLHFLQSAQMHCSHYKKMLVRTKSPFAAALAKTHQIQRGFLYFAGKLA